MKLKSILCLGVLTALFGGMLLLIHPHPTPVSSVERSITNAPLAQAHLKTLTNEALGATNKWPDDPRPAAQQFFQFAKAAQLYHFDPVVTYYKEELPTNHGKIINVGTSTHETEILGGNLINAYSYRDRSHSSDDYPEVMKEWYLCTGTWTEKEAVDETLAILQRLGDTETLRAVQIGRHEYHNGRYPATTPTGERVMVYPFPTVRLFDSSNHLRVIAEYRMGTNGPVGLVDWFHL